MVHSKNLSSGIGLAAVMVLLLLALSVSSPGGAASPGKVVSQPSMGVPSPGQINCGQAAMTSESPLFELPEGGSCKADATPGMLLNLTPVARGGRTCRCSCGYPCKTDADCGGAVGSCRGGISCCES